MKKIGVKGKAVRGAGVQSRNQYTAEFKASVLARCIREGVAVTARDLDLPESMLYAWRKKAEVSASAGGCTKHSAIKRPASLRRLDSLSWVSELLGQHQVFNQTTCDRHS